MITRNFDANVYSALEEIEQVKMKSGYDKRSLPLFGDVIRKYHLEGDLIISLAHRHFDLQADEKMVSDYLIDTHEWITKPMKLDEQELIPWNWKLAYDPNTKHHAWYPVDFLLRDKKFEKEALISDGLYKNVDFLTELAEMIIKNHAVEVFGLALFMPSFNELTEDLVMFEANDLEHRISNAYFIKKGSLNNPDAMTQWHFKNADLYQSGPGILRWCDHA